MELRIKADVAHSFLIDIQMDVAGKKKKPKNDFIMQSIVSGSSLNS